MLILWGIGAVAAQHGPHPYLRGSSALEDAAEMSTESSEPLPSCEEVYPFQLVQLPERPGLYRLAQPNHAWGTAALVAAIEQASARVAIEFPEADPLYVGDLSSQKGGPLPPHITHGDGRSADIGLYADGGEQPRASFGVLEPHELDFELTWTLIDTFLSTGQVEHILLDQTLIDALHDWLTETGRLEAQEAARIFPPEGTERLWAMTGILRSAANHRDHMHVRFRCE
jgi:hypothetical protein